MVTKSLQEIAELIEGNLIGGSENLLISGATNIEEAREGQITFAVAPHLEKASKSQAGAVIIPQGQSGIFTKPVIEVANPRVAFAKLLRVFMPESQVERKIHALAYLDETAVIGKNVAIMPFAVVEAGAIIGDNCIIYPHVYIGRDCKIGPNCTFYSGVKIYENCLLGEGVIVHSGSVIGGDGFGYVQVGKEHHKVPQVGNVVIGNEVEIGCNSCIDCGTTGSTMIGKGTKIDNLVHVGHNDVIGENCLLVAFVGLPGSVKVGNNVTFAGQAASVGHITIGDNSVFAGKAGIISDVPSNSFYAGFPARPHKEWLKQEALQRKLPELMQKVRNLETKIKELEEKK